MLQAHEADIFRPDVTVLAPQEAVPARRERFATRLSPQDLERRAWKRRVNTIHVNTDVVVKAVARFDQMLADLADDVEGQCLVVPAPSGAGKSHLLARLQMRPSLCRSVTRSAPCARWCSSRRPAPAP